MSVGLDLLFARRYRPSGLRIKSAMTRWCKLAGMGMDRGKVLVRWENGMCMTLSVYQHFAAVDCYYLSAYHFSVWG